MAEKRNAPWFRRDDGDKWIPVTWQGWGLIVLLVGGLVIGVQFVVHWW